jgi:hypothetical protein
VSGLTDAHSVATDLHKDPAPDGVEPFADIAEQPYKRGIAAPLHDVGGELLIESAEGQRIHASSSRVTSQRSGRSHRQLAVPNCDARANGHLPIAEVS